MNFSEVLRVPRGTLISGTISIPCQHIGCDERVAIEIEDVCEEGKGGEIDTIDDQLEEINWRCPVCCKSYEQECAEDEATHQAIKEDRL